MWQAKALWCSGNHHKKTFVQSVFQLWSRGWLGEGLSTLLSVVQVLPYRTSLGVRFRGLVQCSFSPALHTDRSFSSGLACTLTLSYLPPRINLSLFCSNCVQWCSCQDSTHSPTAPGWDNRCFHQAPCSSVAPGTLSRFSLLLFCGRQSISYVRTQSCRDLSAT